MPEKRNPRTGRFESTHRRKRRTRRNPESRAARSAAAKRGWAHRRRARRNPETRAERSRAARAGWAHRRHHHHARRRVRRNPDGKIMRAFKGALTPILVFPTAALAADLVYGFIPKPASMQTGMMVPVGKLGVASILGAVAAMMLPAKTAQYAVAGMVGGVLYDATKGYLQTAMPTLPLHGLSGPSLTYEHADNGSMLQAPVASNDFLGQFETVPGMGEFATVRAMSNA